MVCSEYANAHFISISKTNFGKQGPQVSFIYIENKFIEL